jgi:hypothetical protein
MRTPTTSVPVLLRAGAIALLGLLAFPQNLEAKGPRGRSHSSDYKKAKQHQDSRRERQLYSSHPRSGFVLSFGNGYAGQGYYYGPPNSRYYHQRSDVRYYSNRNSVPRDYYSRENYGSRSSDAAIQRALARHGYYRGHIDGQMGPQSRRAVSSYQRDRGMRPTGYVTTELLHALGLR